VFKKTGFESFSIEVESILNIRGPVCDSIRIGAPEIARPEISLQV
jgi:hypothetical protein